MPTLYKTNPSPGDIYNTMSLQFTFKVTIGLTATYRFGLHIIFGSICDCAAIQLRWTRWDVRDDNCLMCALYTRNTFTHIHIYLYINICECRFENRERSLCKRMWNIYRRFMSTWHVSAKSVRCCLYTRWMALQRTLCARAWARLRWLGEKRRNSTVCVWVKILVNGKLAIGRLAQCARWICPPHNKEYHLAWRLVPRNFIRCKQFTQIFMVVVVRFCANNSRTFQMSNKHTHTHKRTY